MHSTILNNQKFTSKKKKFPCKNKTDFLFPLNTIKTKPTSLNRSIKIKINREHTLDRAAKLNFRSSFRRERFPSKQHAHNR